jgi:hypothetical protein
VVASISDLIGQGIYTPAEVALYTRERTKTVVRWLKGSKSGDPVVQRQYEDERFVGFLDFVQTLAIATIRRQYKVPLQTIREAVDEARKRHHVKYPFAMDHTTHLFQRAERKEQDRPPTTEEQAESERRYELLIKKPDESLVLLTGRHRGNYVIKDIVELYLRDLTFSTATGFAEEYCAWQKDGLAITMNPSRRFGEPLTPSGYTAMALWDAVKSEGSVLNAAKAYGVDPREVELAVSYLDYLRIAPTRD